MHQPGALANASTAVAIIPGSSAADVAPATASTTGGGGGGPTGKGQGKNKGKKQPATMRRAANTKLTALATKFTELRVLQSELTASTRLFLV